MTGFIKGALIFAIPVIAYGTGLLVFAAIGDAGEVETQLNDPRHAIKHRTTLWKRPLGYTVGDVKEFLSALNDEGCAALLRALRADLFFPLLYGAGYAVAAWISAGYGNTRALVAGLLAAAGLTVVSDWTENGALLRLFGSDPALLKSRDLTFGLVATASAATSSKFVGLFTSTIFLILNAASAIRRSG